MTAHRILVTGLGGFVGQVLTGLVEAHRQAETIDLLPLEEAGAPSLDIRDAGAVEAAILRLQPTAVIHLAAIASPREASARPDEAWAVNVMGTFNLAQAVRKHAPEANFVFAGSSEAYGASFLAQTGPIGEDSLLDPLSPYGATKAAADIMLAQMARQGLRAVRFRPFNHTGPGQAPAYVISSFARQIARIEQGWQAPVLRVGNLDVRRDFLDARDVARAYLDAAMALPESAVGGAFNLATGNPVPIRAMLDVLLEAATTSIAVESDPALMRGGEIESIAGDGAGAERLLGWRPQIALAQTLRDVLDYWRRAALDTPDSVKR